MRTWLVMSLLTVATLAGCTDENPVAMRVLDDGCDVMVCPLTASQLSAAEADTQPNAEPVLSFGSQNWEAIVDFVRLDNGWAFAARDSTGSWTILVIDEAGLGGWRYDLPTGQTVAQGALLFEEGTLVVISAAGGSRDSIMVHLLDPATGAGTSRIVEGIPPPAQPRGLYQDDLLIVAKKGLLAGNSSVWVLQPEAVLKILADGRVHDAAMATGVLYLTVEAEEQWRIEMQSITGGFGHVPWQNPNATAFEGIWANDGRIAFSEIKNTEDPAGGLLWELDHRDHSISRLDQGWDVRFSGESVHHLTRSEGTSPFVAEWNRNLQQRSEGVFLPDGELWDVSEEGLWWLEVPRVDHRYVETPNPTDFLIVMMESQR